MTESVVPLVVEPAPVRVRVVHDGRSFEVATATEALAYAAEHGWESVTYWPIPDDGDPANQTLGDLFSSPKARGS